MVGLLRLAGKAAGIAVLATLVAAACKHAEKASVQDGGWQTGAEVAADVPGSPSDGSSDLPRAVADVARKKDASDPVGPRDVEEREVISIVPIDPIKVVFGDTFANGRTDNWKSSDPGAGAYADDDWSIVLNPTPVYCQGSLDISSWHVSRPDTPPIGDQIVEAIVRVSDFYAPEATYMAALFGRYDPETDSGYALAWRGDGRAILRKRLKGATASWDAGVDLGLVAGTSHTLHLEAIGSTVTAFVDGKLVGSFLDNAPLASGIVALGAFGATMEIQRVEMAPP